MVRLVAFVTIPAALMAVASAAPVPKQKPRPLYFPTTVGDTCTLEWGETLTTVTVTAVEPKDGGRLVTYAVRHRPKAGSGAKPADGGNQMFVSDTGLVHLSSPQQGCLLKLPVRAGEPWQARPDLKRTARPAERVTVKARTFEAVPVDEEWADKDGTVRRSTEWFAPRVGLVKSADGATGGTFRELVGFKPGNGTLPLTPEKK